VIAPLVISSSRESVRAIPILNRHGVFCNKMGRDEQERRTTNRGRTHNMPRPWLELLYQVQETGRISVQTVVAAFLPVVERIVMAMITLAGAVVGGAGKRCDNMWLDSGDVISQHTLPVIL
jgi:hypothetical protein